MKCKNCGNLLDEGQEICSCCGEPVKAKKEKQPKKPLSKKAIITIVSISVVVAILGTMVGAALAFLKPWQNDVYNKDNYEVSEFLSNLSVKQVVATIGDQQLTNGRLQVFFWMQVYDMLNYYSEQYGSYASYYLGFDPDKPLNEQVYDKDTGMTWQQYFMDEAFYVWHCYQSLTNEANKAGFQMPEEYQKALDELYTTTEESALKSGLYSVEKLIQSDFGRTATFDDYKYYMELYYIGNLYYTEVTSNLTFSDEELDAYYQENAETFTQYGILQNDDILVDYRKILVKPVTSKDADGKTVITEQAWADCQAKAQDLLQKWESGDKTAESFGQLAIDNSEETSSAPNGGLYSYIALHELATVDVRHILIMPEGGTKDENGNTTYSDEDWEICRAQAQSLLDQYLAGEKTAEAFGALANEHSDDNNGNVTNGGLYSGVYYGQMVAEFEDWIFDLSRKAGDTGLVKTQYGYHVMYFVDRKGPVDEWLFAEGREVGNTTIIKSDSGYEIFYYVGDQLTWKAYANEGVASKAKEELLNDYMDAYSMDVRYWAIMLSERIDV